MAGLMSGGSQNHGFKGLAVLSMRTPRFIQGDGGWNRIVWLPKDLKLELADSIPEEVYNAIATEEDTIDPVELIEVLRKKKHPIVEKYWVNGEPQPQEVPLPGDDWPGYE